MRERKTWLFFLMRRGWLYVQGLIRFGPVRTQRAGKSVRMALDAFEHHYGRLPDTDERSRLVQKLSWLISTISASRLRKRSHRSCNSWSYAKESESTLSNCILVVADERYLCSIPLQQLSCNPHMYTPISPQNPVCSLCRKVLGFCGEQSQGEFPATTRKKEIR